MNNFIFNLLPKKYKRIVILKDALQHLYASRIKPSTGSVLSMPGSTISEMTSCQLQKLIKKNNCKVCQRGAILFSMVWRMNKLILSTHEFNGYSINSFGREQGKMSKIDNFLTQLFSEEQLMLMERAFEGQYHQFIKDAQNAINFYFDHYSSDFSRMEAILLNAIRNGGIFKP